MKLCMGCMNQIEDQMAVCPCCGFNESQLQQEGYYLAPGTIIGGKYIVGRAISYGGYTVTYLGLDAEKNLKVTIKEYLPSDFSTRSEGEVDVTIYSGDARRQFEQGLTTFLNEANRIHQLGKPKGIMQVYDCVAQNDTGYVISEYLEGKTLAQILNEGKIFSPQEAKNFICEILEGLRRVHPLDVVHCDIAPETILVTSAGEIKLLDFGATRYVTTANSKSLAIILKQGYAPEEQYRSSGVRGPWTDVYALGAVMYHMITGTVPLEAVDRALVDELKDPSQLGIQIPPNMESALMNALNVYQKDRTPSAEVFYQELNSAQVKRIQVKKRKYETGKFPAWAKALVAGLLCAALAGGAYILLSPNRGEKVEGEAADSKKEPALNIIGMTEGEAEEALKSKGIKYELGRKVVFDPDVKNGSEILSQEPAAGTVPEKGTVTAEIILSSEKCLYRDLLEEEEVNSLCEKFGIDVQKVSASEEKDADDPEKTYGRLYSVILADGRVLKPKDLKSKDIMTLSDIQSVTYYVSPYFYVKKLENYKGKNIGKIKFHKYTEKKGKKVKAGTGRPPCSYTYFSFEEERGCIVSQRKAKGKSYRSDRDNGSLFDVVKEKISWKGKKADELISELEDRGFKKDKLVVKGNGTEIGEIKVSGKGGKKFFTARDRITITRKKQEARPQAAKPSGKKNKEITSGDGNGDWN